MSVTLRVGIYCRISEDPREQEAGVKRQEKDGRALCALRSYEVANVYVDNDISALKGDYRPEYERLLADVRAGKVTHIVCYMLSRLWRNRRERAEAIELFARMRVSITATKGGEVDLTSAAGRAFAGLIGEFDTMESEIKSERVASAAEGRAEEGRANGHVAYGWRRERMRDANDGVTAWWDVEDPEQAKIVREIVDRLLNGHSLTKIATDLTARQVPPPRASLLALGTEITDAEFEETEKYRPQAWQHSTVRKIALRPANIGKRTRGVYEYGKDGKRRLVRMEVIGDAAWPALVDEDKHHRVVALLKDPGRVTSRSGLRKHLLSFGIGRCGICGGELRVKVYSGNARRTGRSAYICLSPRSCTGRSQYQVDRLVGYLVCDFLARHDIAETLVADDEAAKEARAKIATLRAKLQTVQDDYDDDLITREMYVRSVKRHRAELAEAEQAAKRSTRGVAHAALDELAGPEAERRWKAMDTSRKRALLEALDTEVTLLPTKPGPGFKPESVRVQCLGVDLGSSTG